MKSWVLPVSTVTAVLGALLAMQFRTQADHLHSLPSRRAEDLALVLRTTEAANAQLGERIGELEARLREEQTALPVPAAVPAAYPPLRGPGLVVTLSEASEQNPVDGGTPAEIHGEDVLKIVNELRTGKAEAIALNGKRLTEASEIISAGAHVVVNGEPVRPPYVIEAIGPAEEMKNTLGLRGGVVEYLQFYGITVAIKPSAALAVPGAPPPGPYRYARPATPGPDT